MSGLAGKSRENFDAAAGSPGPRLCLADFDPPCRAPHQLFDGAWTSEMRVAGHE
jgi:hypothetical protein